MSSRARRRRDRLARRRRAEQEAAILEAQERRRRWGDGQIYGPRAPLDLPPMKDVSEVVTVRPDPWPIKQPLIKPIVPIMLDANELHALGDMIDSVERALAGAAGVPIPVLHGKGWPR